ncbi:MAG: von Willebrand factor type A domain-containing protein [Methylacidiphilaceae bacterium]|nr:von Willebrand factor type A domain-containing protein [Candidatus Methylacidiphilaceae bacterium]
MNPHDPKVTNFLFGEEDDLAPEDAAAIASLVASHEEGRELHKAVRLLEEGFSQEQVHLREEQRRFIQKTAEKLFQPKEEQAREPSRSLAWNPRRPLVYGWAPALVPISLALLALWVLHPWSSRQRNTVPVAEGQKSAPVASMDRKIDSPPAPAVASVPQPARSAISAQPELTGKAIASAAASPARPQDVLPPDVRARSQEAMAAQSRPQPQGAQAESGDSNHAIPQTAQAQVSKAVEAAQPRRAQANAARAARNEAAQTPMPLAGEEAASTPEVLGAMEGATGAGVIPYTGGALPFIAGFMSSHKHLAEGIGRDRDWDRSFHGEWNRSSFDAIEENRFLLVRDHPLSTFSADVDTASYAIVRRYLLDEKTLPPKGAVRIEELINYFPYAYPGPKENEPFSVSMESASCPWAPKHRLVRIGIKARELPPGSVPASNLVFLIDVSGSMAMPNKLPLLKKSLDYLVDQLGEKDQVGIVVYAGASGCVLLPTSDRNEIREALDRLEAGGSTNGASGIEMAYDLAERNFLKEGNNRVILATDGDWNVGTTSQSELLDLIAKKAQKKIYLTVLGFGMDNLNDSMLVKLADRGNGNYAYIDSLEEAHKVFGEALHKTLFTVAKDVKLQVEFNPKEVSAYRLIGYEKRLLAKEDFNDDTKDAGEVGAGHTVTVLYEVIPADGERPPHSAVDPLKYQPKANEEEMENSSRSARGTPAEMLTVKIRYKKPDEEKSQRLEFPFTDGAQEWEKSSEDFRFAAAVATFGQLLRKSPLRGESSWKLVERLAEEGQGKDPYGYRSSFLELVGRADSLEAKAKKKDRKKN